MNKESDNSNHLNELLPLQIESNNLATIVLLLDSVEDDVIINACISLYKYVEKKDENKVNLIELKCIEKILNLSYHQCLVVKRLACMILASISINEICKRAIRLKKNSIPLIIKLLNNEDDQPLLENAAKFLGNLATEPSARVAICYNGGLIPLINSLQSSDPDIIKNSIETIAIILKDFECKTAFTQAEGIPKIFKLLNSDFKIIQYHALQALHQLAIDCYSRKYLKEKIFIESLTCFLKNDSNKDLHAYIFVIFSIILDTEKSVNEFLKLIDIPFILVLLNNQQSLEIEIKNKKEIKNTGTSGTKSRKGKIDDNIKSSSDEKELSDVNDLSAFEKPNVVENIIKIISLLLEQETAYKILKELNIEDIIISYLDFDNKIKQASLMCLCILTKYQSSNAFIKNSECVDKIIVICKTCNDEGVLFLASLLLCNLTYKDNNFIQCLDGKGVIDILPLLLSSSKENTLSNISTLIYKFAFFCKMRESMNRLFIPLNFINLLKCQVPNCIISSQEIVSEGCIANNLLDVRLGNDKSTTENINQNAKSSASATNSKKSSNTSQLSVKSIDYSESNLLQRKFLMVLSAFAIDSDNQKLMDGHVLDIIIFLLSSPDKEVSKWSGWLLSRLTPMFWEDIIKKKAIEKLIGLLGSKSQSNYILELALENLLEFCPIEKFALFGYLTSHNKIQDGFYDVGQLNLQSFSYKFKSLDYFLKQPVNCEKPIYFVNSRKKDEQNILLNEAIISEKSATHKSVSSKGSKTSISNKSSKKSNIEEVVQPQIEQTDSLNEPEIFHDFAFSDLIDNTITKLQQIPTTKLQIITLAKIVSEKMGGEFNKSDSSIYNVTDHLNNLKQQLKSNVIPIGSISFGNHYHRALLYKALADRVGIPCSLFRGVYSRSWVEVLLLDEMTDNKMFARKFIVDLINQPGALYPICSAQANQYCEI